MHHLAIVDDNESWCFVMAQRLEQCGYHVSTFTSPRTFLPQLRRFDLVLVDFSIPPLRYEIDVDGATLIRNIKQNVENPPILILISSFFTAEVIEQITDLYPEADAIMGKQVDSRELVTQIHHLLATRQPRETDGSSPNLSIN